MGRISLQQVLFGLPKVIQTKDISFQQVTLTRAARMLKRRNELQFEGEFSSQLSASTGNKSLCDVKWINCTFPNTDNNLAILKLSFNQIPNVHQVPM